MNTFFSGQNGRFRHMNTPLINWENKLEDVMALYTDIYALQAELRHVRPDNPYFFEKAEQALNRVASNHSEIKQLFDVTQRTVPDHQSNYLISAHLGIIERETRETRNQLRQTAMHCAVGERDAEHLRALLQSTAHTLALSLIQLCRYLESADYHSYTSLLIAPKS